jgi:hypothetical protein
MTPETLALGRLLAGDPDWTRGASWTSVDLAATAEQHGIAALVWQALASATGALADVRERLAPGVRATATRDLFIQRELESVLAALAAHGVRALLFKGAALAYTVYDEPWQRPRVDTDVLVAHADVEEAGRALAACGYTRSDALSTGTLVSHQIAFERRDGHGVHHVVDLHWKIVNPQMLADTLGFEALWHDRRPAPALSANASVPSPIASAVIANIHRLAHHQQHDRLIWLVDLSRLTGRFRAGDWQALVELARHARVAGLCLDGLRQSRERLGAPIPGEVEEALAATAPGEPSGIYLARPVHRRDVLAHDLATLGWRARLRLLREHAFPPAAFIRQRYGSGNHWPLPALYVHRLVTGAVRWVRQ